MLKRFLIPLLFGFLAVWAGNLYAQVAMLPAVNTPLTGCIEGRAIRWTNGAPACVPDGTPTITGCGTSPSLSTNATDFAGVINVGTGLTVLACTLNFSKTYSTPMGCVANSSNGAIAVGITPSASSMAITLGLSLGGGKLSYICFPS